MTSPYPSTGGANTVPVKVDARNRAWRTFLQNIWLDICVFAGPMVYDAVSGWEGAFSQEYWTAQGLSIGKTVLLVLISYVMRLTKKPVGATA